MYIYLPTRTLRPVHVFVISLDFAMLVRGFNVPQLYTSKPADVPSLCMIAPHVCASVCTYLFFFYSEHARTSIENKSNHYPAPLAWLVDFPLVNTLFQSQLTQHKLWRFYEQILCLGKLKSK